MIVKNEFTQQIGKRVFSGRLDHDLITFSIGEVKAVWNSNFYEFCFEKANIPKPRTALNQVEWKRNVWIEIGWFSRWVIWISKMLLKEAVWQKKMCLHARVSIFWVGIYRYVCGYEYIVHLNKVCNFILEKRTRKGERDVRRYFCVRRYGNY